MAQMSKEYAAALFSLASETNVQTEIMESLELITNVFKENPEYVIFLSSQNIPKKERIQAVQQLLSDKVHEYTVSFIAILCERGYIRDFEECVKEYTDMYRLSLNISTAKVVSAIPLSEAEKSQITAKLEARSGHSVMLECSVDPSIMGGLIVSMDGEVLDSSIRHRLNQVKKVIDR